MIIWELSEFQRTLQDSVAKPSEESITEAHRLTESILSRGISCVQVWGRENGTSRELQIFFV